MFTSPLERSRAVIRRIGHFGATVVTRRTIRRIERLPEHVKRDIGWPPYGDLDERSCS